jgi:uncharacterized protein
MRIAVFSDTHGNKEAMRHALQSEGPFHLLLHLGDGVADGMSVSDEAGIKFCGVQGNEDIMILPPEISFCVGKWTLTAVHGHQMDINPYHSQLQWNQHFQYMVKWAKRRKSQLFLFGHSHCPALQEVDGVVICNPGDQYLGSTGAPTFAVIHVEDQRLKVQLMERFKNGRWRIKAALEKIN